MSRKIDRSIHKMLPEQVADRERFKGSNAATKHGDRRLKRLNTRGAVKAKALSEYR